MSAATADVDLPSHDDWHTPTQLAPKVSRSAYTVREYLRSGALHGHELNGRWRVKGTVADAWVQGLDIPAQRRVCGCSVVSAVPARRGRRRP